MAAKTNPSKVTGPLRIGSVPQTTGAITDYDKVKNVGDALTAQISFVPLAFNDNTTKYMNIAFPPGSTIFGIEFYQTEAFDQNVTFDIGDDQDPDRFVSAKSYLTTQTATIFSPVTGAFKNTGEKTSPIYVRINNASNATQGSGYLVVTYCPFVYLTGV